MEHKKDIKMGKEMKRSSKRSPGNNNHLQSHSWTLLFNGIKRSADLLNSNFPISNDSKLKMELGQC
jgi:hypothetical protein